MKEVLGNTDGLKNNIIESLLQLYELKAPPWQLVSAEIVIHMAKITTAVNREVNVFLDRKGNTVLLGVRDNGSGIAAEDLPYLFDRYYKAPTERGGLAAGSGIGLSLAKKIAGLHGGTIDVESKPGKGSCFTVRIPLSDPM